MTVTDTLSVDEGKTLANAGALTGKTVSVAGTLTNTAESGVEVESLNLTKGKVDGAGSLTITTALTTAADTTFTQASVAAEGTAAVAGTFNITDTLTLDNGATFASTASGTVADADVTGNITHSGSMKFTDLATNDTVANQAGTLTIDSLTGTSTLTNAANATLDLSKGTANKAASLANSGVAKVKDTTFTGALQNNTGGSLTGTGTIESASFTNAAEANLVNLTTGAVTASGETNVTGKLKGTSTASFDATATGTIAEAEITGNITHKGAQTFTKLTNSAAINNEAGTLTITTLAGDSAITNATGATLAMANGTQEAASLANSGTANLGTFTADGDITNAGTVSSTGKVTAQNYKQTAGSATVADLEAKAALETAGTFTATGGVTAVTGTNTGTFKTKDLTITTSLANASALESTGTADITALTQTAGSAKFKDATLKGTGALAGTVEASGALKFDAGSSYTGEGSITAKGALTALGDVLMTGAVKADGLTTVAAGKTLKANGLTLNTTSVSGTLEETGKGSIADLAMVKGATLKNSGILTVTAASAVDGVTYEQTGDGALTMSDGKWFSNSTINVFGGSIARGANGLGTGNTYNIKNASAGDIPDTLTENWRDNRTVVSVDTLDMSSVVNLQSGGVLDAGSITFTAVEGDTKKILNFDGGALVTTLDQLFKDVATDALDMEAMNPETGRVEITGNVVGLTSVGDFKTGIKEHTTFKTGDIVFEDTAITVDLVNDVSSRIGAVTDEGGTIDLHFTGSTAQVFTADVANSVITGNSNTRAIFDSSTLFARNADNPAGGKTLIIAASDEDGTVRINGDIGFKNVAETELVKVKDGKEFALIGTTAGGSLIGNAGAVEVIGAGSTFTLGTLGRSEALKGTVAKVTLDEGGRLYGKAGDYTVTTIDAADGTVETAAGGTLNTTTLNLGEKGILANAGTINATNWVDVAATTATNSGKLNVTNAATVAGTFTADKGSLTNFAGKLTVTGKVTNKAEAVAAGEGTRAGTTHGMTLAALDVKANDGFVNEGDLYVTGATNLLAGNDSASSTATNYVFHNKKGAAATLAGKLTVGGTTAVTTKAGEDTPATESIHALALNEGTMTLGEVEILAGSQLQNAKDAVVSVTDLKVGAGSLLWNKTGGTIEADKLTSEGSVRNFGTLNVTAGDFSKGETVSNNGRMLFKTLRMAGGAQFFNEGDLGVEDGEFKGEGTDFVNGEGTTAEFNELTVQEQASYANQGTLKVYKSLVVEGEGTKLVNSGEGSVAEDIKLADSGLLSQEAGSFTGKTLTIEGGTLQVAGGSFSVTDGVTFTNGVISYKGSSEKSAAGALALAGGIGGTIAVENSSLTLGKYQAQTGGEPEGQADKLPEAKHIFQAGYAPVELGATGKLAVGADALAKAEAMTGGDAWFGADSLLVIDTKNGMTNVETKAEEGTGTTIAAMVGSGNLAVDAGAKLHVKNVGWGTYYVTKDFAKEVLAEGSWDKLVSFDPDDSGKDIVVKQDEEGNVLLTVVKVEKPVEPGEDGDGGNQGGGDGNGGEGGEGVYFPNASVSGNVEAVISNPDMRDPNAGGAIGFINRVVELDDEGAMLETINAVGNFASAAGLVAQNYTFAGNVLDVTERHLSRLNARSGEPERRQGVTLWADALGQKVDQSGASYTGGKAEYDGTNYGFIFGGDLLTDSGVRFGAAFGAQRGDIDSKGGIVSASNEADAYSLTAYAAKNFGALNVIGTAGWTHVDSELEQSLGVVGMGKHKLDMKNDIFSLSVKGELSLPLSETFSLVPHAGLRYVAMLSDDAVSQIDGKDAFKYEVDSVNQFQLPLGVALEANHASGEWNVRGVIDATVIPAFGDKDSSASVKGVGIGAVDRIEGAFSDDLAGSVRAGFSAESGNFTFGGDVGYTKGGSLDSGITFGVSARYRF